MTNVTVRESDLVGWSVERSILANSTFKMVDLRNAAFDQCNFDGATIDGVKVTELLATYRSANRPGETPDNKSC